jgi:flagellar biosynthesis protein FlhF
MTTMTTSETRTYRGSTLEELLPTIRAELGENAVIIRQREGLVGGIGGFFARRCVEVEAQAAPTAAAHTPAVPAGRVFDAYDATPAPAVTAFEDELARAEAEFKPLVSETVAPEPERELEAELEVEPASIAGEEPDPVFDTLRQRLVDEGLPEAAAAAVVREAERGMAPFDQLATPEQLVRRALARQIKIEHGWKTKRRTVALVGPAGSGKTMAAARLCHAYAVGSRIEVRTLSLEPSAGAYRLGQLTDHLDIGLRIAESPEAVARAMTRMQGDSLTVIDTPPVSIGDPAGIAELGELLAEAKPDETHLVVPASMDARAARALFDAVSAQVPIARILITGLDDAVTPGGVVGLSFAVKKPISYVAEGRRPSAGLRPADGAELASMVLPEPAAEVRRAA